MSKIISISGKGGTGKSTITALIVDHLVKGKKGTVLAIDADPNSTLAQILGVQDDQKSIVEIADTLSKDKASSSGMGKASLLEYKIHEAVSEEEGFDLLTMGRPEGPGCYCYINSLLKDFITKLSKSYDYVVIDNEAGMEHLSRRTARKADVIFIVSDYTAIGVRTAKRIYDLIKDLRLEYKNIYLIANKVNGNINELSDEIDKSGLSLIGDLPYSSQINDSSLNGEPLSNLRDKNIIDSISKICKKAC